MKILKQAVEHVEQIDAGGWTIITLIVMGLMVAGPGTVQLFFG